MSAIVPTREEIEADVLKLDPALTDTADETFRAAAVMLFVAQTGCFDQRQVASALGYPSSLVAKFFFNLRRSHVFQGRKIYAEWGDPEAGGLAFWMDCAVAQGLIERWKKEPDSCSACVDLTQPRTLNASNEAEEAKTRADAAAD